MNNCFKVKSLLSAYLDRELSGEEMMAVRDHVQYCADCSAEFDSIREVKAMMMIAPTVEPRPEFFAELQGAVLSRQPLKLQSRRSAIPLGMAAAILFLMFAVLRWVDVQRDVRSGQEESDSLNGLAQSGQMVEVSYRPEILTSSPE
jgi:predicted anti-sigma-YlaC factor YlaD